MLSFDYSSYCNATSTFVKSGDFGLDHLENLGVDKMMILKKFLNKWNGHINWINPAKNVDRLWQQTSLFYKIPEISWLTEQGLLAS